MVNITRCNGKTIAGNKIVLLNTTTISNDATVSIDNFVDPNTHVYYKVIGENIKPATDGQQFRYYFRTGGASGSDITANYSFSGTIHLVLKVV